MDEVETVGRDAGREHILALDALRHAKNAFFWLAVVAIALHLVLWVIVRWAETPDAAARWQDTLEWMLAVAGFVGRASAVVVAGISVLVLLIGLNARLSGTAALARACVWSLAALALVVPWVRITAEDMAGIPSAFFEAEELARRVGGSMSRADAFFSFVRFVVCPILVGVSLGTAQYWFHAGYRRMTTLSTGRLPIREV
jgi:hypothetical protein